jgi:hypothetical protein
LGERYFAQRDARFVQKQNDRIVAGGDAKASAWNEEPWLQGPHNTPTTP